ncbi:uncharacterized protein LOC110460155 [Mizuhopecten yessoensis]|uniref:uncharacterized protein LOC110460155 n=1 Tax=Mizuhopecten yessoensis TaxID=6573 RepID=UPI000B45F6A8|nr:uncharacterized protein LOC110460155 [Mizuhopecten yessoensis]
MALEEVFRKYDYVHGTEETDDALQETLVQQRGDFEDAGNVQNLQKCMSVLQEKICVKGFPAKRTPGYIMASNSLEVIKYVMNDCVDNDRATEEDCQKMLFDFLLACLRTGPGSALGDIIGDVLSIQHMENYLEALKGKELTKLISAMKEFTHTSEEPKMSLEDQSSCWDHCICGVLDTMSESKNLQDADFQEQLLDLFIFYFLKMKDVPVEYDLPVQNVMDKIKSLYRENYDRNPYKNLKNKDIFCKHMIHIQDVIGDEKFGRSEKQVEQAHDIIRLILKGMGEHPKDLKDIWDNVLDFMKTLSFSKKCAEFPKIMERFKYFFEEMPKGSLKEHPQLVDKWAPVFGEILLKTPSVKALETWVYRMADTVQEECVLKKDSAAAWFPILKGLYRCGQRESAKTATDILDEGKFKKIWTWKKNYQDAIEMIEIIGKVDFPTSGDNNDSNLLAAYGDGIKSLLEQLTLAKVADKTMGSVANFVVSMMEKRSGFLNEFTERFADKVSLENNQDVIPDLVKRFSVLFLDADYPWDNLDTSRCGQAIFDSVISAYSSGKDMPDDVTEILVKMLLYSMEAEDLEYMNMEYGSITIYGLAASAYLIMFVTKHAISDCPDRALGPLMAAIVKQMDHEEEPLLEAARNIMAVTSSQVPALVSPHVPTFIQWYQTTHSVEALYALSKPYQVGDGISKEDFEKLMKAFAEDPSSTAGPLQSLVIMDMGEKQPELFTQEHVDMILSPKMMDDTNVQYRILMAMSAVISKQPQLFGNNVIDCVLKNPKLSLTYSHAIKTIGVSFAFHHTEFVETVLTEFLKLSKKCDDPNYQVALVDGIRTLGTQHGIERLKPHRPYIEELQKNGKSAALKDQATSILNEMDGISVEGIVKDVEQQKGDINVLNTKVTETTAKVDVVDKKVDKQGKEIVTVKTGLKATNKRVDNVEKDLDETKIKVEEVDNKTMTNAPKWSRDLTKLMNPQSDHDWRLLAKRLAYTPDDIKGWATQHDPCMGLLSEWYATHKTIEATHAVLVALQEIDRMDGAAIVENAMKAVEGVVEEEVDYATPPPIFLSYQWGHQNEVKLLRNHLQMAGYECWMDIGQMGGGDKLFEKIDNGIRGAKIIICCVSEKYSKSPNCNREVNLSVSLGKPMIPLLMEKMAWPPKGSMGPIFSEYLFVRFFQRGGEETKDQRFWPVPKFQELLMQLNMYKAMPDESLITEEYKDWWTPVAEEIVITKKKDGGQSSSGKVESTQGEEESSPDVFLSYQWGKQKQIKQLYRRLNELGYSCWMDIYQMGGGDSLYDKIDRGVRGCKVVLSCVTSKYALSANCRREVSLADSLKKPMVPLLLEKIDWPPTGPMSMVFTQLLFINFYRDEAVQMSWNGDKFDELSGKIQEYIPAISNAGHPVAVKGPDKSPTESKVDSPPTTTKPSEDKGPGPKVTFAEVKTDETTKQTAPKEETKPAAKPKKSSACVIL